jgi:hypothetical protein
VPSLTKKVISTLAVGASAALMLASVPPPAQAADRGSAIYKDERLNRDDYIKREFGGGARIILIMQNDGNLVLYWQVPRGNYSRVCWSAGIAGKGGRYAIYQKDGNFVVYDKNGKDVWASKTKGETGATVDISSNGRLYIGYTAFTKSCIPSPGG